MTSPAELPTDLETCHQLIRELLETLTRQTYLNEKLQHQLEQLLRRIYGRRSEKLDPNQLLLFAREILEATGADPAATTPPGTDAQPAESVDPPKKNGHGRKRLPKNLERRRKVHDVPPEKLPCPDCGTVRTSIGEEIHEQLDFIAASLVVIQTDDTTVPVLDRTLAKTRTGRLWDYLGDRDHPFVVYDYTPDRSGAGPLRMLDGYEGYLQADAYAGYDALYAGKKIIEVGCWAHARRKFVDAKTSDAVCAHVAMAMTQRLYKVEKDAKDLDDAAREALRQERSKPILNEIHDWLLQEKDRALPKSPIGEAIGYALNHWQALERYTEAGWQSIDNNASERGMKPVALGRKNWLFAGSDAGGKTAATLMSLCMTCKNLGIDPFVYLRDILERISTHPARRIGELLPDQWKKERAAMTPNPVK